MKLDAADLLLQKVATIALMYYPELPADSPSYKLDDDIDWCLVETPEDEITPELRELIGRTVVDPTAHRESLTDHVYGLVPDAEDAS